VNAGHESVDVRRFGRDEVPRWPGWDLQEGPQWHGLMTSVTAAGNGWLSHGLYRGLASDAELVLVQVRDGQGRITNDTITRALHWLHEHGATLGVRVVSASVAGDPVEPLLGNSVDDAIAALVAKGVLVVTAAGNDGRRQLVPPATAPLALTVGGLDDQNTFDHVARQVWHSNYGDAGNGASKPELVAPSLWVVAPILPGTTLAAEAGKLLAERARSNDHVEHRITDLKLVTPHYQHVEGTSFAAPVAASVAACMLEANPNLTPLRLRQLMTTATHPVHGADPERQGAGALDAGRAVALVLADHLGNGATLFRSPEVTSQGTSFRLHDAVARDVRVLGSWNGWQAPGVHAEPVDHGVWQAHLSGLAPGRYAYKFLLDGQRWLTDPLNPRRASNGQGGWNSVLVT
jgi:serine protease AprX